MAELNTRRMHRIAQFAILAVVSLNLSAYTTHAFSIESRRLHGIWKLKTIGDNDGSGGSILPRQGSSARRPAGGGLSEDPFGAGSSALSTPSPVYSNDETILIKLNPDGSFRQCNEGYQEGSWLSGCWSLVDDQNKLVLAVDRQYYGPPRDILLEGILTNDDNDNNERLRVQQGTVSEGKFRHPNKRHASFFNHNEPLLIASSSNNNSNCTTGSFFMEQAVATHSVMP